MNNVTSSSDCLKDVPNFVFINGYSEQQIGNPIKLI